MKLFLALLLLFLLANCQQQYDSMCLDCIKNNNFFCYSGPKESKCLSKANQCSNGGSTLNGWTSTNVQACFIIANGTYAKPLFNTTQLSLDTDYIRQDEYDDGKSLIFTGMKGEVSKVAIQNEVDGTSRVQVGAIPTGLQLFMIPQQGKVTNITSEYLLTQGESLTLILEGINLQAGESSLVLTLTSGFMVSLSLVVIVLSLLIN